MSAPEFEAWREFYRLYPFDDFHRFHRPAALIAAGHPEIRDKAAVIDNRLAWLQPEPMSGNYSEHDLRTLAAFGQKPPRG